MELNVQPVGRQCYASDVKSMIICIYKSFFISTSKKYLNTSLIHCTYNENFAMGEGGHEIFSLSE